jgi:aspartate-semialdehyde dehydrogenase
MQKTCSAHTSRIDALQGHANEVTAARDQALAQLEAAQQLLQAAEAKLQLAESPGKHLKDLAQLRVDNAELHSQLGELQVSTAARQPLA